MSYTDSVAAVADRTEAALLAAREDPTVDFLPVAVALLTRARAHAVALADLGLATDLTRLWRRYVAPLGLPAPDEPVPVEEVAAAAALTPATAAVALGVVARATVLGAAQTTYIAGLDSHGVESWTRETNAGACPLCEDMADGTELPTTTPMWHHKGCGCTPRPTQ